MTSSQDWFARYKFCQPLGQGGMGTVYLAEDRVNGNIQCVIKQLTNKYQDPEEQSEAVRLFQREAAILRSLSHPGIVRVFDDYASEDGRYFLVMDYVPGRNLEIMINTGGPFGADLTAQMAIQCCEVLEYLHGQDPPVIYRDLKPSNLMLTPEGRIVFIDFGIARAFVPKEAATRVVTAGYSPPEQYFGKPEIRSDLYALGATIFHLLTGKRPKPLNTSAPGLLNSRVPDSLDALCRRLTAHNPDDRPSSARSVRFQLYKICKELIPDFEIPAEAAAEESAAELSLQGQSEDAPVLGEAFVRARAGRISSRHDMNARESGQQSSQSSRHSIHSGQQSRQSNSQSLRQSVPSETPSLWQRFKQWFTIWTS